MMHTEEEILQVASKLLERGRKLVEIENIKKSQRFFREFLTVVELLKSFTEERIREGEDTLNELEDWRDEASMWQIHYERSTPEESLALTPDMCDFIDEYVQSQEYTGEKAASETKRLANLLKELVFKQGKSFKEARKVIISSVRMRPRRSLRNDNDTVGVIHGELNPYH